MFSKSSLITLFSNSIASACWRNRKSNHTSTYRNTHSIKKGLNMLYRPSPSLWSPAYARMIMKSMRQSLGILLIERSHFPIRYSTRTTYPRLYYLIHSNLRKVKKKRLPLMSIKFPCISEHKLPILLETKKIYCNNLKRVKTITYFSRLKFYNSI